MAVSSGTPVSVVLRESANEPQTAFEVSYRIPGSRDKDGNVTTWHKYFDRGILISKQLVVEGRGNWNKSISTTSETEGWFLEVPDETGKKITVTEGYYNKKTIVIERHRINEAGFYRYTKTTTISALYVNGVYKSGITDFDSSDYSL